MTDFGEKKLHLSSHFTRGALKLQWVHRFWAELLANFMSSLHAFWTIRPETYFMQHHGYRHEILQANKFVVVVKKKTVPQLIDLCGKQ